MRLDPKPNRDEKQRLPPEDFQSPVVGLKAYLFSSA
jgi:hypothetical protein